MQDLLLHCIIKGETVSTLETGISRLYWSNLIVIYALNMDSFFPDEYEAYCTELETTPAWGGQIEVEYLNLVFNTQITIAPSVDNG